MVTASIDSRIVAAHNAGAAVLLMSKDLDELLEIADRIVVLEEGEVMEDGQHDDLVSLGGIYARLWSVQTGESR